MRMCIPGLAALLPLMMRVPGADAQARTISSDVASLPFIAGQPQTVRSQCQLALSQLFQLQFSKIRQCRANTVCSI